LSESSIDSEKCKNPVSIEEILKIDLLAIKYQITNYLQLFKSKVSPELNLNHTLNILEIELQEILEEYVKYEKKKKFHIKMGKFYAFK